MVTPWWILLASVLGVWATVKDGAENAPPTVEIFENETVLLPCYVDSIGVPTRVRWWHEDVLVADTSEVVPRVRVKMWDNRSLEVSFIQREDAGLYVCQASRPAPWGHVTQVHAIRVKYPPSVHTIPESGELEVNMGENVEMSCVAEGVPFPIITWRSKGEDMHLLDHRARLQFNAENRSLSGRYSCIANNGVGEPAVAHINLRIRYKPEIEAQKTWVHASPGLRAQLHCKVSACPEAQVEWFFKEERVRYSARVLKSFSCEDHSLIIRNVRDEDYGYYLCRASNSLGITEKEIELSGVANPAVFKKESHVISRTAYKLIWEVDSYSPIIGYQLLFRKRVNGRHGDWRNVYVPSERDAIGSVHAHSYNLTGLAEATHYEVQVLSRNRYGLSRPSKIFSFATPGAPDKNGIYTIDNVVDDKSMPVVELASMSQHSYGSAASLGQRKTLMVVLPVVCFVISVLAIV
ncbi:limbic system-associated membrane protein isoform X2 [Orussus abietinus]|uniref:limbic system-associated membrane protein isoform X2 n=1 Tax=Orussus abietinus TaxID=222816 RepID=UPI000C71603F|nr:limbic system-associated membrane protein isoform X2 [Orussus abietinus]